MFLVGSEINKLLYVVAIICFTVFIDNYILLFSRRDIISPTFLLSFSFFVVVFIAYMFEKSWVEIFMDIRLP